MQTALRFLQLVRPRVLAPGGPQPLVFDGAPLLFDGAALTFQTP